MLSDSILSEEFGFYLAADIELSSTFDRITCDLYTNPIKEVLLLTPLYK